MKTPNTRSLFLVNKISGTLNFVWSLFPNQNESLLYNQWSTAFNTFATVYSIKYPSLTPTLLKYCEVVKDLANRSACWRWYDEQFRYLRQTKPDSYHWEQVQWDLWFQAHLIQDYSQQQSYSGLRSPGRSCFIDLWNDSWVQTFHNGVISVNLFPWGRKFFTRGVYISSLYDYCFLQSRFLNQPDKIKLDYLSR